MKRRGADHFFGCLCDEGYTGYDCSVRTCARGDDPLTGSQLNDIQVLECHADFGTFTLTFRRETTGPISVDASVTDVTNAINTLTVLEGQQPKVAVSWTGDVDRACITTGNNIQVTFLQDFGDLPLLIPDGTKLGQTSGSDTPLITAQNVVTGTKESDICSNHGTCDKEKGICQCLGTWMTSDGHRMLVHEVTAAIDRLAQLLRVQENQRVSVMELVSVRQLTGVGVRLEDRVPTVL